MTLRQYIEGLVFDVVPSRSVTWRALFIWSSALLPSAPVRPDRAPPSTRQPVAGLQTRSAWAAAAKTRERRKRE